MANVKISALPSASVPTDNDIIPMTDYETLTTQGVSAKYLSSYISSSIQQLNLNSLTASNISTIILGSTRGNFSSLTGSFLTSSQIIAGNITASSNLTSLGFFQAVGRSTFGDNLNVTGSIGIGAGNLQFQGGVALAGDGAGRISSTGIFRSDNGYWIGGVNSSWTTSGLVFSAGGATAWLSQNQTSPTDARVFGTALSSGSVGIRVGSQRTDSQGALSASLLTIATDAANSVNPSDKWIFTGQQELAPQGTAASASISFIMDRNSGLYQPQIATVGIAANSTGTLFVGANQVIVSGTFYGYSSAYNNLTGNYVLTNNDNGKVISINSLTQATVTVPLNLTNGFGISLFQVGTGSLFITSSVGVTIFNRQGHTRTAGQYAACFLTFVSGNAFIFGGDTTP